MAPTLASLLPHAVLFFNTRTALPQTNENLKKMGPYFIDCSIALLFQSVNLYHASVRNARATLVILELQKVTKAITSKKTRATQHLAGSPVTRPEPTWWMR